MPGPARPTRHQRGFTLIEILIALGLAVVVGGIALAILQATGHGLVHQVDAQQIVGKIDQVADQMEMSANTSEAVYTVGCGNGTGDGAACSEVRFYGKDSSGGAHFWGWSYSGGVLTQCKAYQSADGACAQTGYSVQGVLAFTATPQSASAIGAKYGSAIAPKEVYLLGAAADPSRRVVAGNRVVVVDVSMAGVSREKHLLQGNAPFSAEVINRTIDTPATQPITLSPNPILLPNAWTPGSTTAHETNFGQYQIYYPKGKASDWGSDFDCKDTSGNVLGTITQSPPYNGGDYDQFTVHPIHAGTCTFDVYTADQSAATATVHIGGGCTSCLNNSISVNPNPVMVVAASSQSGGSSSSPRPTFSPIGGPCGVTNTCGCVRRLPNGLCVLDSGPRSTASARGHSSPYVCAVGCVKPGSCRWQPGPWPDTWDGTTICIPPICSPGYVDDGNGGCMPATTTTTATPTPTPTSTSPPAPSATPTPAAIVPGPWASATIVESGPDISRSLSIMSSTTGSKMICSAQYYQFGLATSGGTTYLNVRSIDPTGAQPQCWIPIKDGNYDPTKPALAHLVAMVEVLWTPAAVPAPVETLSVSPTQIWFVNGSATPTSTIAVSDNLFPTYNVTVGSGTGSGCAYLSSDPSGMHSGNLVLGQNAAAGSGSCALTIGTSGTVPSQAVMLYFSAATPPPPTVPGYGGGGGGGGGGGCTTVGVYDGGAQTTSGAPACRK